MGFFDSQEDIERKDRIDRMKTLIAKKGLANIIDEKDYQKVLIEQNQTIIDLLIVSAIAQSGIAGDAVTLIHQNRYFEALERVIKS